MRNEEVIMFTCGLLQDCSSLSGYLYNIWIDEVLQYIPDEKIDRFRIKWDHRDIDTRLIGSHETINLMHLERLYMESQVMLPGKYKYNQFINVNMERKGILFLPSKFYWIQGPVHKFQVRRNRNYEVTCASYMIEDTEYKDSTNILSIYCRISQSQPASNIFLKNMEFSLLTDSCSVRLSPDILSFSVLNSSIPPHILFDILKQLSESSRLNSMYLHDVSLVGIKSLNLTNKVKSLSKLILTNVVMDQQLCDNLLRQMTFLSSLIRLEVTHEVDIYGTAYQDMISEYGMVCEVN